jgi:CRP/FNR family cyclic AMP-dependent transcriptional regulator
MFDSVLHIADYLNPLFPGLNGVVRDDFLKIIAIAAWTKALTAISAAYMKSMIPLRTMSILNNALGIAAGAGAGSLATFIEHALNFPLNAARLKEMRCLIASVREASESDLRLAEAFYASACAQGRQRVFSQGDNASGAFVLVEGRIAIPERSAILEPGAIFGEMALFTAAGRRTASAVCHSDVRLLVITCEQFEQLYFQNPESLSISFVSSCAASR